MRGSTNLSGRVQASEVWSFLEVGPCDFGNALYKFAYVATKCGIIHTKRDMVCDLAGGFGRVWKVAAR